MMHKIYKFNSERVTYLIYFEFLPTIYVLFCQNVLTFLGLFAGVAIKDQTNRKKLYRDSFDHDVLKDLCEVRMWPRDIQFNK